MQLPDEPETSGQINIVPMIDVIFAILTFFIMSTLFLNRTEGLPVNLPKATTAKLQNQSKIVITIDAQGKIALNRQTTEADQIKAQLQRLVDAQKGAIVIINADQQVPHGRVITVMDQVRQVPGARLAVATQQP
ncbi:biopolymer transporter ExbD [Leptolyngbya sp. 'hensonii']|uniref:ExbD/TolR family protein n=1 Tax=Leptolyngbya sp. 'hensonii' TaxID=1922337 RepID=UPI00094FD503|nr:biopolymer transporter ExbD [Leptolyngbya sp. 'hensonii']OLP17004.1 biopolymer transporter ExbD [Leptolyngbya sp. 'hensonii']